MAATQTAVKMAPEQATFQKVTGTIEQRFYYASHQENVFVKADAIPLYGRVLDLSGKVIQNQGSDSMSVVIEQDYGECHKQSTIPVSNGYFETTIWPMSDDRSFYSNVQLNTSNYLKTSQQYPFNSFMKGDNMFMGIQTVNLSDRTLGGIYKFRVIDALSYEPVKDITGQYRATSDMNAEWTSSDKGEVYLDNLKVGLTNVQITSNPTYFNNFISGAKVFKPSMRTNLAPGRTILAVPRELENTMAITLTWVGSDYKLSMIAETSNPHKTDNCITGFFNPKCPGIIHLGSNDQTINGETITIHPNAFLDSEGNLIPDKKILIYVTNGANNDSDITASSAQLAINMPNFGQVSYLNVPFRAT